MLAQHPLTQMLGVRYNIFIFSPVGDLGAVELELEVTVGALDS